MKTSLVVIIVSMFAFSAQAQTIQFSDVYLFGNSGSTTAGPMSQSDKNFLLENMPTNHFQNLKYDEYNARYSNGFGIMTGWNIKSKKRNTLAQKLRLGFMFNNYSINFDGNWSNSTSTIVDTFVSVKTGDKIYVDSTFEQRASMNQYANMLYLDANYIVSLMPQRKLSLYTGIGTTIGFSLQNYVKSYYSENSYVDHSRNYNSDYYSETYSKKLPTAINGRVYMPLGFNYRLSNHSAFFRHINLFGEFNVGLEMNEMEGVDTNFGFYYGIRSGVRVSFLDLANSSHGKHRMNGRGRID